MLSLHVKRGEYITIADNIVIQVLSDGGWATLLVDAPREIPVLRGALREKIGLEAPAQIHGDHPKPRDRSSPSYRKRKERYFDRAEAQRRRRETARAAIDRLEALSASSPEGEEIRRLLREIAPLTEENRGGEHEGQAAHDD